MTWGVNLRSNDSSNAVEMAKSILAAFSPNSAAKKAGIILDAIQIGNEPDLYARHGFRPNPWSISSYVAQCVPFCLSQSFFSTRWTHRSPSIEIRWESFADAIINATGLTPNAAIKFLVGGFSASSSFPKNPGPFNPQSLFEAGILKGKYGSYIDTYVIIVPEFLNCSMS